MQKKTYLNANIYAVLVCFFAVIALTTISSWYDSFQHKTDRLKSYAEDRDVVLTLRGKKEDGTRLEGFLPGGVFELYEVDTDKRHDTRQYKTNMKGEIWVTNLGIGSYYFKEVIPPFRFTYDLDEEEQDITVYPFEVTRESSREVPIHVEVDNILIEAQLKISKTVENRDGTALSDVQLDELFSFEVCFDDRIDNPDYIDDQVYTYQIDKGPVRTIHNGGVILLKSGQQAVFKELEYATRYAVREINSFSYNIESIHSRGILLATRNVEYKNKTKIPLESSLKFTKTVENEDKTELRLDQTQKDFEFTLEFNSSEAYLAQIGEEEPFMIRSGETFLLKHLETIHISGLPKGLVYSLKEKDYSGEFYYSDKSVITGKIVVNSSLIEHSIRNIYDPMSDENGNLIIRKLLRGEDERIPFSFEILFSTLEPLKYQIDGGDILDYNEGEFIELLANQEIIFKNIPYGTEYLVRELELDNYESELIMVQGIIASENTELEFMNHNLLKPKDATITVHKEVERIETDKSFDFYMIIDDDVHEFSLKNGESWSIDVERGSLYYLIEKDYTKDGYETLMTTNQNVVDLEEEIDIYVKNIFHPNLVRIDIEGEKTWDVIEEALDLIPESIEVSLIRDDDIVVDTIEVGKDADGRWLYSFTVPKFNLMGEPYKYAINEKEIRHFEVSYEGTNIMNTYLKPVVYAPHVRKDITNGQHVVNPNIFEFVLTGTNKITSLVQDRTTIVGEGITTFKELMFEQEGEYTYRIHEIIYRDSKDYTFDTIDVYLKIVVGRVGNEFVIENITYSKKGYEDSDVEALFVNEYIYTEPDVEEIPKPEVPVIPDEPYNPEIPNKPEDPIEPVEPKEPDNPSKPDIVDKPTLPDTVEKEKGKDNLPQSGIARSFTILYSEISIISGVALLEVSKKQRRKRVYRTCQKQ